MSVNTAALKTSGAWGLCIVGSWAIIVAAIYALAVMLSHII